MNATRIVLLLVAFLTVIAVLIFIFHMMNSDTMGFEPKEEVARKIYDSLGGVPTRDLRYEDFIRKYPEGDNSLYADIKKLDVIDIPGLMQVL